MLQIQHRVRKYLGECINLKVGQRRKERSGQTWLKQNADKPDSECLRKRTAQWYRQEPDFPEFAIYLFTTTCREEPLLDASYSGKQYGRSCLHLPSFGVRQAAGGVPQEAQGGHRLLDLRMSVVKYNILKKFKSLSHCGRFQG